MNDNMRKFVRGLMVSTVSKGVLPKKGEPVAYLYNGVQLPKLPEWDREKYPYAFMCGSTDFDGSYYVTINCLNVQVYRDDDDHIHPVQDGQYIRYYATADKDDDWTYFGYVNDIFTSSLFIGDVFWTNTDILNEDGTLYLAASDPVPVYE